MYLFCYALAWVRVCAPAGARKNDCKWLIICDYRRNELEIRRRDYCPA